MIQLLQKRISEYSQELGRIEVAILQKRITNLAHELHKQKIRLEAKIELSEELLSWEINNLK